MTNLAMGRFCAVIVGYVLLGFTSCAPLDIRQNPVVNLLQQSCPNVKNMNKLLPEACASGKVPAECEVIVDYTLRICKEEGFSFDLNVNIPLECPLNLPAIKHKKFVNNSETHAVMGRLANKTECLLECVNERSQLCHNLVILASLVRNLETPTTNEAQSPGPAVKLKTVPPPAPPAQQQEKQAPPVAPTPAPIKMIEPVDKGLENPSQDVAPPPPGNPDDTLPKPEVVKPNVNKPAGSQGVSEDFGAGKSPDDDLDVEPEPNLHGPSQKEDYDEQFETESKTEKPSFDVSDSSSQPRPIHSNGPFQDAPDSHFFAYFIFFTCISVTGYIAFHNKNKILALALEGRRGRQGRKRPNSASYRKLDNSLEEAIMSNPSRVSNAPVIY